MRFAALIVALCILIATPGWTEDQAAPSSNSMMEDLARLGQRTHAARETVLKKLLLERNIPYSVERFSSVNRVRPVGANIVVTLGSGPKDLIVCAHYDAVDLHDGTISQGMIDNGASVIALMRLAEALKGTGLRHRVRIVFADLEENGCRGSADYVRKHSDDKIAAVLNLDVISAGRLVTFGEPKSQPLKQAIEQSCADLGVKCVGLQDYPPGDDTRFRGAGIPTISMAVIGEEDVRPLLQMFDPNGNPGGPVAKPKVMQYMHTHEDTPDKVSEEAMSTAYEVLLRTVRKLDASPDL